MPDLLLVDRDRTEWPEPYVIRLPGWTYERFLDEAPEMRFCEYVDGELIMPSPVSVDHQRTVGFLSVLLTLYCRPRKLGEPLSGPAVLRVSAEKAREPDIFVVPPADVLPPVIETPPRLIVEVVSPGTRTTDLGDKAQEYATFGVPEYWVVDRARRQLHVHRPAAAGYAVQVLETGVLKSTALAGFWIDVDWLWLATPPDEVGCLKQIEAGPPAP